MSWDATELPDGWKSATLGEVAKVVGGGTPKTSDPGNFSDAEGHPWITPADLTGYTKKYIRRGKRFLTDQGLKTSSAKYLPANSVLFSSRAPIGYVAIAEVPVTTNQGFRSFVPNKEVNPEYLYYALKLLKPIAERMASGTTFAEISGSKAAQLPIVYPSLEQQDQIVRILDVVTAKNAAATANLITARRAIEHFRQAVLAAACSGRLTADWQEGSPDETAYDFLDDIVNRRERILSNTRKLASAPAGYHLDIPEGWVVSSLDRLSARITSGSRDWSRFYGHGSGTFVMAQNVRRGYLDWSFSQKVDPPEGDSSRERSQIDVGDLLVTIVGANTGDVGPVTDPRPEHYVCQSVALVRPVDAQLTPFLNLWFNSPAHGRGYFEECIYGAGRPHLSFDQLKAAPVAIPPLAEQHEIARRVSVMLTLADSLMVRINTASQQVERTSQAVLAKAFRGELASIAE